MSPHFLPIYYSKITTHDVNTESSEKGSGWVTHMIGACVTGTTIPAVLLLLCVSICFTSSSIVFAFCIQTILFVTLNKVCTAQYFTWYMCLLPLITPYYSHKSYKILGVMSVCWCICLCIWLFHAYHLEFNWVDGQDLLFRVWCSSLLFYVCNMLCICMLIYTFEK